VTITPVYIRKSARHVITVIAKKADAGTAQLLIAETGTLGVRELLSIAILPQNKQTIQ